MGSGDDSHSGAHPWPTGNVEQAVTIAEAVALAELGTAIDARRRFVPPATAVELVV